MWSLQYRLRHDETSFTSQKLLNMYYDKTFDEKPFIKVSVTV